MGSVFAGKIALVTGAASGLGLALSQELRRCGATVVLTDINPQVLQCADDLDAQGFALDVTDQQAVEGLIADVTAQYGRLDYLFNNAGIAVLGEASEIRAEEWRRLVEVNLMGVVHGAAAAYSVMRAQRGGHIVNTASVAGMTGFPMLAGYAATKAAVIALSSSLRAEGAEYGVKVSVLCPGCFRSAIYPKDGPKESMLLDKLIRLDAASAAVMALRGVERNQGFIVFPRWAWWCSRLWAWSMLTASPIHRFIAWKYRKLWTGTSLG